MHVCKVMTTTFCQILIESFFIWSKNVMLTQNMNKVLSYEMFLLFLTAHEQSDEAPVQTYTRRQEI